MRRRRRSQRQVRLRLRQPQTSPLIQATPAALPDPQTPEEFFARARQLSDLEASGIPFHLKATYVASGDAEFTGNGAYEEWWQSKDVWRKEATLGDYKYVAIKDGEKTRFMEARVYSATTEANAQGDRGPNCSRCRIDE